jgi:hypothetical protein
MRLLAFLIVFSLTLVVISSARVKPKPFFKLTKAEKIALAERMLVEIQGKPVFKHSRLNSPIRKFRELNIEGGGKVFFVHKPVLRLPEAYRATDRLQGQPQFPGQPQAAYMRMMKAPAGELHFDQRLGEPAQNIKWYEKPRKLTELPEQIWLGKFAEQ